MQTEMLGKEIEAFGLDVIESSGRSLDLLRGIESTIKTLNWLAKKVNADCEFAVVSIQHINMQDTRVVDVQKTEKAIEVLERAQTGVQKLHDELVEKRGHAAEDKDLHPDDGVVEAFSEAIAATADLHNNLNTLRWVIAESAVDSEPKETKVYSTNELDKFLSDLKR